MGYVTRTIEIHLRLNAHNDERDERDRKLADEIECRIGELLEEPQYEHLYGAIY